MHLKIIIIIKHPKISLYSYILGIQMKLLFWSSHVGNYFHGYKMKHQVDVLLSKHQGIYLWNKYLIWVWHYNSDLEHICLVYGDYGNLSSITAPLLIHNDMSSNAACYPKPPIITHINKYNAKGAYWTRTQLMGNLSDCLKVPD